LYSARVIWVRFRYIVVLFSAKSAMRAMVFVSACPTNKLLEISFFFYFSADTDTTTILLKLSSAIVWNLIQNIRRLYFNWKDWDSRLYDFYTLNFARCYIGGKYNGIRYFLFTFWQQPNPGKFHRIACKQQNGSVFFGVVECWIVGLNDGCAFTK
jgi:hypothetical protein